MVAIPSREDIRFRRVTLLFMDGNMTKAGLYVKKNAIRHVVQLRMRMVLRTKQYG